MNFIGEKMIEEIINELLEWKFFRNNWYDLTEEEREELKNDLRQIIDE